MDVMMRALDRSPDGPKKYVEVASSNVQKIFQHALNFGYWGAEAASEETVQNMFNLMGVVARYSDMIRKFREEAPSLDPVALFEKFWMTACAINSLLKDEATFVEWSYHVAQFIPEGPSPWYPGSLPPVFDEDDKLFCTLRKLFSQFICFEYLLEALASMETEESEKKVWLDLHREAVSFREQRVKRSISTVENREKKIRQHQEDIVDIRRFLRSTKHAINVHLAKGCQEDSKNGADNMA